MNPRETTFTRMAPGEPWEATLSSGKTRPARASEVAALQGWHGGLEMNSAVRIVMARFDGAFKAHAAQGPAIITADGARLWFRNGDQHRDGDLPAYESVSGLHVYYRSGKIDREFGPASYDDDGRYEWWRNGDSWGAEMSRIFGALRCGGRTMEIGTVRASGITYCRVVDLAGGVVLESGLGYRGWYDWIVANTDRFFPEMAAANRAIAMRQVMENADPDRITRAPRRRTAI